MKARSCIRRALILLLVFVLIPSAAFADALMGKVISSKMYVYPSASTEKSSSVYLPSGAVFAVNGISGAWAKITYKGNRGYAQVKDMIMNKRFVRYTAKAAPAYRSASTSSTKLGTLPAGTAVYIAGYSGSYFLCQNKAGSMTCYINKDYLTASKPAASSGGGTPNGFTGSTALEYAIYIAECMYGKPYAENPNPPKSFDCALLVYFCYANAGYSMPSSAYSIGYSSSMTKISSMSSLKRGDIVCFDTNGTDGDLSDHVGIYLGNGYFIHASSSAGKVIKSSLTSGYYYRTFSWGRRP